MSAPNSEPCFALCISCVPQKRILVLEDKCPPKWWWTWILPPPWSISVGGIVVVCASILTMGLWIQYWGRDHNYHETAERMSNSELWARTFGQIANMVRYLWAREQTHSSLIESQALLSVRYRVTVTRAHARWCHTRTHHFVYSPFVAGHGPSPLPGVKELDPYFGLWNFMGAGPACLHFRRFFFSFNLYI